jgi:hypothetical protein
MTTKNLPRLTRGNIYLTITHAPFFMSQIVFAGVLVPYLISLGISYYGAATVIAIGALSSLIVQILVHRCQLFSVFGRVQPLSLSIIIFVFMFFWASALAALALLRIMIPSGIGDYALIRTICASICSGLAQSASASLSKLWEYFRFKKQDIENKKDGKAPSKNDDSGETKAYTKTNLKSSVVPIIGIVLGIMVLQIVSRLPFPIESIFAAIIAVITLSTMTGLVLSLRLHAKVVAPSKPNQAVDFCNFWLYPIWFFVLLHAMFFSSFAFFVTDWYMWYSSSSIDSTTLMAPRDSIDLYSWFSSAQAFSLFSVVVICFCFARKGKTLWKIIFRLRVGAASTILLAVAASLLMAYYPLDGPWIVILPASLGMYRLSDIISRYIVSLVERQSSLSYEVLHSLGLIMGVFMNSTIIQYFGYPLLLKIESGLAALALFLFLFSLIYVYWDERKNWKKVKV